MNSDELILLLSRELVPTSPKQLNRHLTLGLLSGVAACLAVFGIGYGVRPDLAEALSSGPFWMKWIYTGSFAALAYSLLIYVSRPTIDPGWRPWMMVIPGAGLFSWSAFILAEAQPSMRGELWLGHSALVCPWNIALLSFPVFSLLCITLRRFGAPTQLRWAGFSAGLLAGALGALIYGLYCDESSVPFVATWYTTGMFLPAAFGSLFGPRLLRWS